MFYRTLAQSLKKNLMGEMMIMRRNIVQRQQKMWRTRMKTRKTKRRRYPRHRYHRTNRRVRVLCYFTSLACAYNLIRVPFATTIPTFTLPCVSSPLALITTASRCQVVYYRDRERVAPPCCHTLPCILPLHDSPANWVRRRAYP